MNNATIPLFYALIKTHKPGQPIRPIVSFSGSPSYNLAQFVSKILTPLSNVSEYKLKNTVAAKEALQGLIIPENHSLISFDVKQLFTSIPQRLAIQAVNDAISNNQELFKQQTALD